MTTLATAEWAEIAVQEVERRHNELQKRKEEVKKRLLERINEGDKEAIAYLTRIKDIE